MTNFDVFQKGAVVLFEASFTNVAGVLVDPSAVTFKLKNPAGVITSYVYGTDDEVVKAAVGKYSAELPIDAVGPWYWRWESTGEGQGAEEGEIRVPTSQF